MQKKQLEPIAIVGIGCRFPGAAHHADFWELLKEGKDAIREVPADRWNIDTLYDPDPGQPGKMASRWGGFLDQIDQLDWRALRILPREVCSMDPQQRLLLEVSWEALEDAGLTQADLAVNQTSVMIGIGWSDFLRLQTRDWSRIDGYTATGNRYALAANRISYTFDLHGPSIALDTGCSSSLSAIHLACQSLWTGEATLALAGGVNIMASPDSTILVSKAGLLAPDGRCKTFDAHADGFVRGEGAGIIVLKPLSQVSTSDRVYAVINGVGVNHNGHNEWLIASSQAAQEKLLQDVYTRAGVDPASVDYVELHGTGFQRGDAIEAHALGNILGNAPGRVYPCRLGSVKTNIGHLEAASGIASVIKVALSLYHHTLPPTLNVETLNPNIPLSELNIALQQHTTPWPKKDGPALAAVTTLSLTGANAHMILAAPSQKTPPTISVQNGTPRLLPLSAHSEKALQAQAHAWHAFLRALPHTQDVQAALATWRDLCYTASVRRNHYEHRLAFSASTPDEAARCLDSFLTTPTASRTILPAQPLRNQRHKLMFSFGQKHSHNSINSCNFLLNEPIFNARLQMCSEVFFKLTGNDLFITTTNESCKWCISHNSHPVAAHFALQVALAALWQSWGIHPDAMIGEGEGEIVAAHVAGILELQDAMQLVLAFTSSENASPIALHELDFHATTVPVYSSQIGLLNSTPRLRVPHWNKHLCASNLSVNVIDQLLSEQYDIFVEMGSPSALSGAIFARQLHSEKPGLLLPSLYQEKEIATTMRETLGTLYTLGYAVDWATLYQQETCQCISTPTYQWQRERLWPEWLDVEEISTSPQLRATTPPSIPTPTEALSDTQLSAQLTSEERKLEEVLATLWGEVLGLESVLVEESFFELGGHSLLAGQLQKRIRDVCQANISLSDLLQHPTPHTCATFLEHHWARQQPTVNIHIPQLIPTPEEIYQPFPTTDVQQAYWIGRSDAFELGNVGNHGYIEVDALDIDLERCNQCMRRLIDRHDMLRCILLPDGRQQILQQVPPFEIKIVDIRGLGSGARSAQLEHLRANMDHEMLPIDSWPAFTIIAARLDDQKVRLFLSIESLFIDAWSMNLLIKEFVQLYYQPKLELPPLTISFRDYVLAEEALHNTTFYQRSQTYWMERLATLPPAPELPLAQLPSQIEKPYFVHREGHLDVSTWQRLKKRAAQSGLTPSGLLLAAFAELLAAWSKNSRFSLNLSIFNRLPLHPEVNAIVGDFTSLVVLAIDNSEQLPFEQRAQTLQEQLWRDLDHSYFSGIQVLRELTKLRGGGVQALMPVVFTSLLIQDISHSHPYPWQETIYCVSQTPQVWLDHQVLEQRGALVFHWQTVEELFPAGMIDAMFASYQSLLERLANDEFCWQESPQHMVPSEQLAQRTLTNATTSQVSTKLLHTLFEEQATRNPTHTAVITSQRTLSYKELLAEATAIAHHLRKEGVRPNQLVGVVMEKGWEQIVAVLAILQAGGAYLPIDARLPQDRQLYLLEHGQVHHVLTQSWIDELLQWPSSIKRICVNHMLGSSHGLEPLTPIQSPEDLAYVIYTSGSTGLPKGVMVDHRGAVNTILDMNQRFNVTAEDRVLALSALNFDLSVYDIFGLLATGGAVVIPDANTNRDPSAWLQLLVDAQVTIWNSVPALMQMFVDYAQINPKMVQQTCLRLALWSGDWIPLSLPDKCRELFPGCRLVSLGGATEASIWSILYPIGEVHSTWKSIPYGKPMLNQTFAVLNEHLKPCPVWVPGQLYIGGIGLAKGYWRDEQKTNASFFVHPHTGERLYRTGDLGRYLPDGNIEFLGREDFQVKIQGHRIELGEIEETLLKHPAVQVAVANAVTDEGGSKSLVGYIVLKPEFTTSLPEALIDPNAQASEDKQNEAILQMLRHYLEEKLPEYMIPATFMLLETLPLSANGKVERKKLPTPQIMTRKTSRSYSPPTTDLEQKIVAIWQEMLPRAQVGIHDNFFDLGGNSILMVRAYTKLYHLLGSTLSLVEMFFQYPTIHELVQHLSQTQQSTSVEEPKDGQELERREQNRVSLQQQRQARRKARVLEEGA